MGRCFVLSLLIHTGGLLAGPGEKPAPKFTGPELTGVLPLGGRQGTTFPVQVRGRGLAGASAAWFPCDDLQASIERVEEIPAEPPAKTPSAKTPKEPEYRVKVSVTVSPQAKLGFHALRLVTPLGLSNALPLEVVEEPIIPEQATPHFLPADAQPLQFPAVVSGTISKKGEVDFYSSRTRNCSSKLSPIFSRTCGIALRRNCCFMSRPEAGLIPTGQHCYPWTARRFPGSR